MRLADRVQLVGPDWPSISRRFGADIAPRDNRPINRRRRRGIVPQNAAGLVNTIQTHLASFGPATEGQKTLHAEAYRVAHYHP